MWDYTGDDQCSLNRGTRTALALRLLFRGSAEQQFLSSIP